MTDPTPDPQTPPATRAGHQRRREERRRLWDRRARMDRRAAAERRLRQRRRESARPPHDHRTGLDRRRDDRRGTADRRGEAGRRRGRRRRDTPTPYSNEELAALRARFAHPGPVSCPACGGPFTLNRGMRRGDQIARRVTCLGCGRAAAVPHSLAARVLVVDHGVERRDALRPVLTHAGHEVIEADEAAVALLAYQVAPVDVVLLNVLATGRMEAPEFMRRLRRDFPDARVVAVAGRTSQATSDPLAVAHGLGAVQTLRIPASPDAVLRTVDEARR